MSFTWESTFSIAMELRRQHPKVNMDEVSLQQLQDWILAVPDFEDDPALVNDGILMAIFQEWFEENINGKE